MKTYIIAEAGVNHNGKIELAYKLVDEAKKAGADCVKFQTFKADKLVAKSAPKAEYQTNNTGNNESQYEMLKKLELSFDDFVNLKKYCSNIGIDFLSTPFDKDSLEFLNRLDMPFWKIPSGEITNYPYLVAIAKTHKPVVLSTGMCDINDIKNAFNVLKDNGVDDISILHCNTEYPTPLNDVNLRAMDHIRRVFGVRVGYSDHTKGINVPIAAVALGATIIEKHFTLDNNMEGPDHKASLNPSDFSKMVEGIRDIEKALGIDKKIITESERKNISVARKSIVASRDIKSGEVFSEDNLTTKRPGTGISPMRWNEVIGKKAKKDFVKDEAISL